MKIPSLLFFFWVPFLFGMELKVFNVGQGNCTAITCDNGPALLVDGGSSKHPLDPYTQHDLSKTQIVTISKYLVERTSYGGEIYIVISHGDEDHYGWIPLIALTILSSDKNKKMKLLLGGKSDHYKTKFTKNWFPSKKGTLSFSFLIDSLKETYSSTFEYAYLSQLLPININTFLPSYAHILVAQLEAYDKEKNDTSIVLKIQNDAFSALLPGDATGKVTDTITGQIDSIVLLSSHHGSHTHNCTSELFLHRVKPRYVILSAGMHENYHHPAYETVLRIIKYFQDTKQPLVHPHTVTFYTNEPLIHTAVAEFVEGFKIIARYSNGFTIAVTQYPLYNTTNAGTITFRSPHTFELECAESEDLSFIACALRAPVIHNFSALRSLMLEGLGLRNEDICRLPLVPPNLTYCDLRNNKLGLKGIFYLLRLINKTSNEVKILKLNHNLLFKKKRLDEHIENIEELRNVDIESSFNKKPFKELPFYDHKWFQCKGYLLLPVQRLSFKDVYIKGKELPKNMVSGIVSEDLIRYMGAYNIPLGVSDSMSSWIAAYMPISQQIVLGTIVENQFNTFTIATAPYHIDALCFSPNTIFLACALYGEDRTYIYDRQGGIWRGPFSGRLFYNEHNKCGMLGEATYSFNTIRTSYNASISILSPFSHDSKSLITFSKITGLVYLWNWDRENFKLRYSHNVQLLRPGCSCNDIKFISFADDERSLVVHYKDCISVEMRLLLDSLKSK